MNSKKRKQTELKRVANKFSLVAGEGTLKQQAWAYGSEFPDWKRRVVYGLILQKFQNKKEKKAYEQKISMQMSEEIEEATGKWISL